MNDGYTDKSFLLACAMCFWVHGELLDTPSSCHGTGSNAAAFQTHKMTWSAGVHQLCSAFISLVSLCLLSPLLCLAHMQGW